MLRVTEVFTLHYNVSFSVKQNEILNILQLTLTLIFWYIHYTTWL